MLFPLTSWVTRMCNVLGSETSLFHTTSLNEHKHAGEYTSAYRVTLFHELTELTALTPDWQHWRSNIHKYGVICVCSWLRILFCYITSIILSVFPFTLAFKGFFVSVPYRTDESAIASVSVVSHANYIKPTICVTRCRHYSPLISPHWRAHRAVSRDYDMVTLLIFTTQTCVEAGLGLIWREIRGGGGGGGNEHVLNQVFITNDAMHIKLAHSDIW